VVNLLVTGLLLALAPADDLVNNVERLATVLHTIKAQHSTPQHATAFRTQPELLRPAYCCCVTCWIRTVDKAAAADAPAHAHLLLPECCLLCLLSARQHLQVITLIALILRHTCRQQWQQMRDRSVLQ
jgi:hypothetical protein